MACGLLARGYLQGQADQQLRAYAARLASHPFKASPLYGVAGGVPGAAGLGIEVRAPAGQVGMRAGSVGRPGPVIPAVPAAVAARGDHPAKVAAGGGDSWLVITEPIHYRARRIPFSYSAQGFYVVVTSTARRGLPGTLVIGLDLRSAGHAVGIFWGYVGLIESLIKRIRAEYGEPMKVVATGGLAEVFKDEIGLFDAIEPDLMSLGLLEIWRRNRS